MMSLCMGCVHFDLGSDYEKGRFFYCDSGGERFYSLKDCERHYLCRFYFSEQRYCSLRGQGYSKEYIEYEILGKIYGSGVIE